MTYPDVSIIPFNGKTPRIHESAFIAPGCRIIGDVEIGPDVSIWYNCVLRGDVNFIRIGARSNIQDGSVIHVDSPAPNKPEGFPTIIGEDVLVGHLAMVHGCVIEDRGFVGLGAIVMSGAHIESDGMLAAGAMLTGGKRVLSRQLWSGRPAVYMRDLNDVAITEMQRGVQGYVRNGQAHKAAVLGATEG
ncbi:gamma carbonic anhydrase family protein [Novosphingobium jiangmenense]|uniref:Gamma carbonic anhydrase family protein n=1 Tax=Novosphingobium jiangmenense TaxID=2791981 RepID=A0ABS0HGC2_9SPHN|nr:gamma carbonic anhydrase family protein [Novosphingobium jiangmenense]MBF9150999.1 gamma carbonic anhydrase family protein [Novosphingobium jiangmenense]